MAGNEQMMTGNESQLSGLFGVYLQVGDLDRSLSFYRDVLALEVVWNDGALAVLHSRRAPADSLVIREIGKATRHKMGEAGVTRVLWRAGDPAELDSAEELLTRQQVPYRRHRDTEVDGITMRDPDGLEIVLLWIGEKALAPGPPAWLYWSY
jgi:catechol-2,3-dioxygenase